MGDIGLKGLKDEYGTGLAGLIDWCDVRFVGNDDLV